MGSWARGFPRLFASVRDIGAADGGELAGVRRSLTRQSVLVAVATAIVDTVSFSSSGIFSAAPGIGAAVAVPLILADLAFAAPPATAGVVAVAQTVLRVVATAVLHGHGLPLKDGDMGFLIAGYRAGAWLSGRASLFIVPILALGSCSSMLIVRGPTAHDWLPLVTTAASTSLVPWLIGRYTAAGGAYVTELEQRERLRRQEQRAALDRALADEREAIARDLHDVISHHVSAIGMHAGAARMALSASNSDGSSVANGSGAGDSPAIRSLAAVEAGSRAAMVDLRRQLDLLHGRDEAGRRQPGLADIEELAAHVRETGLDLDLLIPAAATPLPESLDVTVYRIVQEMLTNALRHGAGRARLELDERGGRVVITETNPVAEQNDRDDSPHRGLDGIRRRAELFGGTVDYEIVPHPPDAEVGSADSGSIRPGTAGSGGARPADHRAVENHWRITVSIPMTGT